MKRGLALLSCMLVLSSVPLPAAMQTRRRTLAKAQPFGGDRFGEAVAIAGDRIVIGAPGEAAGPGLEDAGAVYLFNTSGDLLHRFAKATPKMGEQFGHAVAFVGNDIVVGVPFDTDSPSGAAYRFDGSSFALETPLLIPTLNTGARLGWAVAGLGDRAVVGAPLATVGDRINAGKAFAFDPDGTLHGQLLLGGQNERLGAAVAAIGDDVLVGLPGKLATDPDGVGDLTGNADVFAAAGGVKRIFPPSSVALSAGDRFGTALALVGGNVLIGAPFDGALNTGAVYLFNGGDRTLLWKKTDPDDRVSDRFGWALCNLDGRPVVGVPDAGQHGAVHVLAAADGHVEQTLSFPDQSASSGQEFGYAIDAQSRTLVVGAPNAGSTGATGVVYLYTPCGDGVVDQGEDCDDANGVDADCCNNQCAHTQITCTTTTTTTTSSTTTTAPPTCGDGVRNGTEDCDEGPAGGPCCTPSCAFRGAGSPCATATHACEADPTCSGQSADCPTQGAPRSGVCRAAASPCEDDVQCDGASFECPQDPVFRPQDAVCRPAADECVRAALCTGSSGECPDSLPADAGTVCATDGNACTDDLCDGGGGCQHTAAQSCQGAAQAEAQVQTADSTAQAQEDIVVTCLIGGNGRKQGGCQAAAFANPKQLDVIAAARAALPTSFKGFHKNVTAVISRTVSPDRKVRTVTLRLTPKGRALLEQSTSGRLSLRVQVRLRDTRGKKAQLNKLIQVRGHF